MVKTVVVVPNWNGENSLEDCINSLLSQSIETQIIVVDNGSVDNSLNILNKYKDKIEVILNKENTGFTGAVNQGFKRAIEMNADFVAPFNNDAVADNKWLENLVACLESKKQAGIATSKILDGSGEKIDSTGDYYTSWGLPYPRGRGESDINKYDKDTEIFGASGGASLYRVKMLEEIGLLDNNFFAYYEDVDLSFRAQLAAWKVVFEPGAVVYHQIGATSSKIKGFTTYQTMKNLPLLLVKNVPRKYLYKVTWRFMLARLLFFGRAFTRGDGWKAVKGDAHATYLLRDAFAKRKKIQKNRQVSDDYIWGLMVHDLPPNAKALRKLRSYWWKIKGVK